MLHSDAGAILPQPGSDAAPGLGERQRTLATQGSAAPAPLVLPIREGGTEPPLYVVAASTEGLVAFDEILPYLEPELPLTGLVASNGPDGADVEGLAERLQLIQPEGPLDLAGCARGGPVAHRLAALLGAAGREVRFLCLIDTSAPVRRSPGGVQAPRCEAPLLLLVTRRQRHAARAWEGVHGGRIDVETVPGADSGTPRAAHAALVASRLSGRLHQVRAHAPGNLRRIRISAVIPARNEALNLPHVLPRIPDLVDELVLVDGGSTDDTIAVAERLWPGLTLVRQKGRGKGSALVQGFRAASGDILIALDADGSTDPAEIPAFVGALMGTAEFVKGSRYLQGGGSADLTWFRSLGNRGLTALARILHRNSFSDLCYGYTGFWRRVLPLVEPDAEGFEIEAQMALRAQARGLSVFEVPSFERPRIQGSSNLHAIPDGWRVLRTVLAHPKARPRSTGAAPFSSVIPLEPTANGSTDC